MEKYIPEYLKRTDIKLGSPLNVLHGVGDSDRATAIASSPDLFNIGLLQHFFYRK